MNSTQDYVLREHAGAVARMTLNRPSALNALHGEVFRQFLTHLDAVEADPAVRVLVLTGAGRAFCAGGDKQSDIGAAANWTAEQRRAEEELAQVASAQGSRDRAGQRRCSRSRLRSRARL